jgi:1,4-dihydroxy-2-naphthoate octaprenyltransferase
MSENNRKNSWFQPWWVAIRPKTLPAALSPVVLGGAFAFSIGQFHLWALLTALWIAVLLQIAANLVNDVVDFSRGADTQARTGPTRVTEHGLLTARQVWMGVWVVFGLAAAAGGYLAWLGSWPVVLVGAAAILAALAYTAGPFPLAYIGLGDFFVLLFFGYAAVCGTVYVMVGAVPPAAWILATAAGALTVNILIVNNVRDMESDRAAGRKNIPIVFGRRAAEWEYALMLVLAYAAPLVLLCWGMASAWGLLSWLSLPAGLKLWGKIRSGLSGPALNPLLGRAAQHLLLYCGLYAVGLVLGVLLGGG